MEDVQGYMVDSDQMDNTIGIRCSHARYICQSLCPFVTPFNPCIPNEVTMTVPVENYKDYNFAVCEMM
jgi:hypothetical protein